MKTTKHFLWAFLLLSFEWLTGQETPSINENILSEHHAVWLMEDGHTLHSSYRNHFLTKEISDILMEGCHTFQGNGVLWGIQHLGHSIYGTMEVRLGYGRRFGKKVAISLQGCYLWRHARNYPNLHSFTITLSGTYQMSKKTMLAISLYNPIRMKYGVVGDEVIPMSFNLAARYKAARQVMLELFIHKQLPTGFELGGVVHYFPLKALYFRLLCSNTRCGIGVMCCWKSLRFFIDCAWHYRIGITPAIDIFYHTSAQLS